VSTRILVAPDKFKGSLSSSEVAAALASGLRSAGRPVDAVEMPLADGGDGSVEVALRAGFRRQPVRVIRADGTDGVADIAVRARTAVVEAALICGPTGGPPSPLTATSRGVGQAIQQAVGHGADTVVLALGGSASTDGGAGLLAALGARMSDRAGNPLAPGGGPLTRLHRITRVGRVGLGSARLVLAADVDSPLLGERGAAAVFGPQKGATPDEVARLEAGLTQLVERLDRAGLPASACAGRPGAGAAGGLGFAAFLLGARYRGGARVFLELAGFDAAVRTADLVVTGEGSLDEQTLAGKLASVVAVESGAHGVPAIAVAGRCLLDDPALAGFARCYALVSREPGCARDRTLSARTLTAIGREIGQSHYPRRVG
jgi:glycerate kinase